jgi:hypothetical protein
MGNPTFDDLVRALVKLSTAMGGDVRWYGVSCALHLAWAMAAGRDVDDAIRGIVGGEEAPDAD